MWSCAVKIKFRYQPINRVERAPSSRAEYDNPVHAWAELIMLEGGDAKVSDIQIDGHYATRDDLRRLAEKESGQPPSRG
jgi:hypothetical protein